MFTWLWVLFFLQFRSFTKLGSGIDDLPAVLLWKSVCCIMFGLAVVVCFVLTKYVNPFNITLFCIDRNLSGLMVVGDLLYWYSVFLLTTMNSYWYGHEVLVLDVNWCKRIERGVYHVYAEIEGSMEMWISYNTSVVSWQGMLSTCQSSIWL